MNEISFDSIEHLFAMGGALGALWLAALLFSLVGAWILAWIKDEKVSGPNWANRIIMNMRGFKYTGGFWAYEKKGHRGSDGESGLLIMPALFFAPVLLFKATTFVIVIAALIGMAHLARFVVRLSKKFTAHTEDKEAHK